MTYYWCIAVLLSIDALCITYKAIAVQHDPAKAQYSSDFWASQTALMYGTESLIQLCRLSTQAATAHYYY